MHEGQIVGGVGISGGNGEQDKAVGAAALQGFAEHIAAGGRRRAPVTAPGQVRAVLPGAERHTCAGMSRPDRGEELDLDGRAGGQRRHPDRARATTPRSPSRSRSTAEAPSATAACSVKPSTAAMNTVSFRHRSTASREPTASATAVSVLPAAIPAASRAVATSTSRPTVPRTSNCPLRRGVIPAVQTRPPCTTAGT